MWRLDPRAHGSDGRPAGTSGNQENGGRLSHRSKRIKDGRERGGKELRSQIAGRGFRSSGRMK
jgi:hypothetical protein